MTCCSCCSCCALYMSCRSPTDPAKGKHETFQLWRRSGSPFAPRLSRCNLGAVVSTLPGKPLSRCLWPVVDSRKWPVARFTLPPFDFGCGVVQSLVFREPHLASHLYRVLCYQDPLFIKHLYTGCSLGRPLMTLLWLRTQSAGGGRG